jgi:hypothetical protein
LTNAQIDALPKALMRAVHSRGVAHCSGCGNEIDPDVCGCGEAIDGHNHGDHSPIPMGCDCYRAERTPSQSIRAGSDEEARAHIALRLLDVPPLREVVVSGKVWRCENDALTVDRKP